MFSCHFHNWTSLVNRCPYCDPRLRASRSTGDPFATESEKILSKLSEARAEFDLEKKRYDSNMEKLNTLLFEFRLSVDKFTQVTQTAFNSGLSQIKYPIAAHYPCCGIQLIPSDQIGKKN